LGQQFFDNVSGASFSHGLLYFLQGDKLYAIESSPTQISKVAANSVLSGDFLITPAGTFQLKGQTLQKVSSKVRLPLLGSISPGPTFISDNYRLVFTDKGWTEEIQDANGLKVNGLLMWKLVVRVTRGERLLEQLEVPSLMVSGTIRKDICWWSMATVWGVRIS